MATVQNLSVTCGFIAITKQTWSEASSVWYGATLYARVYITNMATMPNLEFIPEKISFTHNAYLRN